MIERFDFMNDGYAINTNSLFVTSRPLKRKKPTQQYLDTVKYFNTHDFSVTIVDGKPVIKVTERCKIVKSKEPLKEGTMCAAKQSKI